MFTYSEKALDHFKNPRNVGTLADPDGVGEVGSLACGQMLRLMFKLDNRNKIVIAKFQAFGCASAIDPKRGREHYQRGHHSIPSRPAAAAGVLLGYVY
jgi:hypothetical protein